MTITICEMNRLRKKNVKDNPGHSYQVVHLELKYSYYSEVRILIHKLLWNATASSSSAWEHILLLFPCHRLLYLGTLFSRTARMPVTSSRPTHGSGTPSLFPYSSLFTPLVITALL